ncbi:MAG: hypothetical protein LBE76_05025 [Nitrososphaerota archaeon]|jgi:hypothetical protein|nr:hypothetical protein [Nitrososphaerota archaeon]
MRLNATRLGLILVIIGVIMLFNLWTVPVIQSYKAQFEPVDLGETFAYGLFLAPLGLGNIGVESDTVVAPKPSQDDIDNWSGEGSMYVSGDVIRVEYEAFVRLVVVSPSGVTLVDTEGATPYSVPVDFTERGEYVLYVTNLGNETVPIPVSIKFPPETGVVYREADKFFVSIILTASGTVLLCIGLATTLLTKHKKTTNKSVADVI